MTSRRWLSGVGLLAGLFGGLAAAGAAQAAGDAARGRTVFARCMACHAVVPGRNGLGPTMAGVVGRKAASVAGFRYSPAMQASKLTWNRPTLDRYLAAPQAVVKGTFMSFPGMTDAKDRADVIAYLATLAAK